MKRKRYRRRNGQSELELAAKEIVFPADKKPPRREMLMMLKHIAKKRKYKPGWMWYTLSSLTGINNDIPKEWRNDPPIPPNKWLLSRLAGLSSPLRLEEEQEQIKIVLGAIKRQ
jgi:hypothetical protein